MANAQPLFITFNALKSELQRILAEHGLVGKRGERCATLFAETTLDGVYTHGLRRFPGFISSIRNGIVDPEAMPTKIQSVGNLEQWDGNRGPGNLNAYACMERAVELAKASGIGCVGLRNTNHWMRGGSYGWQAADAGCLAVCFTNTTPNLPPWGGSSSTTGNNPFVVAAPRREGHVVLDIAMSQYSYGKLAEYAKAGQVLPVPGGYDSAGSLSTDPKKIFESDRVLPMGYWKGSGLSLLLDLFATVLSGGLSTREIGALETERRVSQVFIAVDPSGLGGGQGLDDFVNHTIDFFHSSRPVVDGKPVLYPGEGSLLRRKENLEHGIPVERELWERVKAL